MKFRVDNCRDLLFNLVSIKSVSANESEATAYMASALPGLGWDNNFIDDAGNVVASKGSGERELVLMGHIDTVPGGPDVCLSDGRLHGRGSVDAKGPLCAFVAAGGRAEVPQGWKLTLIGAVQEETSSMGARYRIPLHTPAACIIGEPSNTTGVTIGYRGSLRVSISGEDGGFHRSSDQGPLTNCLMAAASIIEEIEGWDDSGKKIIERPHGAVVSMVGVEEGARKAEVVLDIRIPIGEKDEKFKKICEEAAQKRGVEWQFGFFAPPYMVSGNDKVVRSLRNAIRKCGFKPQMFAKGGTADFNLASSWNCPIAAYGPGDSKLDHTDSEHILMDDYFLSIEILEEGIPMIFESIG